MNASIEKRRHLNHKYRAGDRQKNQVFEADPTRSVFPRQISGSFAGSFSIVAIGTSLALYPFITDVVGDKFSRLIAAISVVASFLVSSRIFRVRLLLLVALAVPFLGNLIQLQVLVLLFGIIILVLEGNLHASRFSSRAVLLVLLGLNIAVISLSGSLSRGWFQYVLVPCLGFLVTSGIKTSSYERLRVLRSIAVLATAYSLLYVGSSLGAWPMPLEVRREATEVLGMTFYRIWAPGGPLAIAGLLIALLGYRNRWFPARWNQLYLVSTSGAILATLSRSIIAACAIAALVGFLSNGQGTRNRFRAIAALIFVVFIVVQTLPRTISISAASTDQSALARISIWRSFRIPDLLDLLLGSQQVQSTIAWDAGHVEWLYGLGLLPFLGMYVTPLLLASRRGVENNRDIEFRGLARAFVVCILVAGIATDLPFSLLIWVTLGIVVGPSLTALEGPRDSNQAESRQLSLRS